MRQLAKGWVVAAFVSLALPAGSSRAVPITMSPNPMVGYAITTLLPGADTDTNEFLFDIVLGPSPYPVDLHIDAIWSFSSGGVFVPVLDAAVASGDMSVVSEILPTGQLRVSFTWSAGLTETFVEWISLDGTPTDLSIDSVALEFPGNPTHLSAEFSWTPATPIPEPSAGLLFAIATGVSAGAVGRRAPHECRGSARA